MADFIIPAGRDYVFTVKILNKDSFIARNLNTMTSMDIEFLNLESKCKVDGGTSVVSYNVLNSANGLVQVSVPSGLTDLMVSERGGKVDGYYLKPTYKCVITVKFSDDSDVLAIINKVYILELSC